MKPAIVTPQRPRLSLAVVRRGISMRLTVAAPTMRLVEDLGLFLRHVLETSNANADDGKPPTVAQALAIDKMVSEGTAPSVAILQELLLADDSVHRIIKSCSPTELCVLLHLLVLLKESSASGKCAPLNTGKRLQPLNDMSLGVEAATNHTIAATSDVLSENPSHFVCYSQLRNTLMTTIQHSIDAEGRNELLLAFDGDAMALRADVVALLAAERHLQEAATLLKDALQSTEKVDSLSMLCIEALQRMAVTGRCVPLAVVQELASATGQHALVECFKKSPRNTVQTLMLGLSRAATASLSPDILALWTALQSAASARDEDSVSERVTTEMAVDAAIVASDIGDVDLELYNGEANDGNGETLDEATVERLKQKQQNAKQLVIDVHQDIYATRREAAQELEATLSSLQSKVYKTTQGWVACDNLKHLDELIDEAIKRAGASHVALKTAGLAAQWKKVGPVIRGKMRFLKLKRPSLAKLEIIRDFAQTISLVFTNLYTKGLLLVSGTSFQDKLQEIQAAYRGTVNAIAADFTAVYLRYGNRNRDVTGDVFFGLFIFAIVVACACFCSLIALLFVDASASKWLADTKGDNDEARKRRRSFIRRVTTLLTICQSLHLPIARLSVEIITGTSETSRVHKRYGQRSFWNWLYYGAWVLLLYVLGLMLLQCRLIYKYAPRVETSDHPSFRWWWWLSPWTAYKNWRYRRSHRRVRNLHGVEVEFHNSVYGEILRRDPVHLSCPYRSLYSSFEHSWRYYKVIQQVLKVTLTMLLVWFRNEEWRAILTSLVAGASCLATFTAPFIDSSEDLMELSGKVTAFTTTVGGTVLVFYPNSKTTGSTLSAFAVSVTNLVNTVLMGAVTLVGVEGFRLRFKNWCSGLTFSDSKLHAIHRSAKNVLPNWDVEYEIRHRVWHAFWKKLLLSLGQQDAAIQRLVETKSSDTGGTSTEEDAKTRLARRPADECIAAMRLILRSVLEGPDVYFEPPRDDRTDKHRGGFGKLTVEPYPFKCVFEFDELSGDIDTTGQRLLEIVDDKDVAALFLCNFRYDIIRKRELRQQLRALSAWGQEGGFVELSFEQQEQWPRRSQLNQDGLPPTDRAQEPVPFQCRYTRGLVSFGSDGVGGVKLSINLRNGVGDVYSMESNHVVDHVDDYECMVDGPEAYALLGISVEFDGTAQWHEILQQPLVTQALAKFLSQIQQRQLEDRTLRIGKQAKREGILSSGFYDDVYMNHKISRHELEAYLRDEPNEVLSKVPITHRAALDLLYERLHFIMSDSRVAFWFVFWHDLYEQNGDELQDLRAYRDQFDPERPTAIAYRVIPREELQSWFQRRSLFGPSSRVPWRKTPFHDELLKLLYECFDAQLYRK